MMGWYNDTIGWGGWAAMSAMMLVFWGLAVFAVIAIFRGGGAGTDPLEPQDPMKTLAERFARGEIDAEEYRARTAILRDAVR